MFDNSRKSDRHLFVSEIMDLYINFQSRLLSLSCYSPSLVLRSLVSRRPTTVMDENERFKPFLHFSISLNSHFQMFFCISQLWMSKYLNNYFHFNLKLINNSFIAEVYNNEQYFGFLDHFSNIMIHKICLKYVRKHKLPDDFASL